MADFEATSMQEGTMFRLFFLEDTVLKQRKSVAAVARSLNWYHRLWSPRTVFEEALEAVERRDRSLELLEQSSLDPAFAGQIEFLDRVTVRYDGEEYVLTEPVRQEKLEPLRYYLRRHVKQRDLEEVEKRFEDFVNLQREFWLHELFDTQMEVGRGYGLDEEGQLRLLDSSVLIGDRDRAGELLEQPLYFESDFYFRMKVYPYLRRVQKPYIKVLAGEMTMDELEDYWPADS